MTFSDSFRSVLLGSRKMNSENLGTEIYSVNYIINNAEYTVTHRRVGRISQKMHIRW